MYLIPRNVVTKFQIFPGFGWFELGTVLSGAAIGGALFGIASLLIDSMLIFILLVIPPGLAFTVTKPGPDGLSFYELIRRKRRWEGRQRRYLYRRGAC
ncbi:MAG: PrgI family protein [Firmicutes bacterium]|nr:PrgI family protein [Bacillota bacterium]